MEYQVLETVSKKTLLGIRFWDPSLNAQVSFGLSAILYPVDNHRKRVYAICSRSGVYAFNDIPGMLDVETASSNDEDALTSPMPTKQFVLKVNDPRKRFVSVALLIELPLPYNGLFLVDDSPGSPGNPPPGFNLYSSIYRHAASQFTFVRGDLINRVTGQPAANALVRVQTEDDFSWYGISNEEGKFAVMMPYPLLNISFGGSPSTSDGVRLFQRTWSVNISVLYAPLDQVSLADSELPDYSSILNQDQALIYPELPETIESPETVLGEVTEVQADLVYGRDLIIKTAGYSELYISPTGSPA
jgi:hypothetical protein